MAKSTFRNHKKLIRLQHALGLTHGRAYGLITYLWDWAQEHCPSGLLDRLDLKDVLVTIGGHIAEESFEACLEAMTNPDHRWLDKVGDRYYIHDWHDHCENSVHAKLYRSLATFGNGALPKPTGGISKQDRESLDAKWAAIREALDTHWQELVSNRDNESSTSCQLVAHESSPIETSCQLPLPKPMPKPIPEDNPPTPLAGGTAAEPPWWEGRSDPAAFIASKVDAVRMKGGKRPGWAAPEEQACKNLAEFVAGFDPGDDGTKGQTQLVESVLAEFEDYHLGKLKPPYTDPVRALRNWFGKREPTCRAVIRSRRAGLVPVAGGGAQAPTLLERTRATAERFMQQAAEARAQQGAAS